MSNLAVTAIAKYLALAQMASEPRPFATFSVNEGLVHKAARPHDRA